MFALAGDPIGVHAAWIPLTELLALCGRIRRSCLAARHEQNGSAFFLQRRLRISLRELAAQRQRELGVLRS
jgi:hypothetical protein